MTYFMMMRLARRVQDYLIVTVFYNFSCAGRIFLFLLVTIRLEYRFEHECVAKTEKIQQERRSSCW